MKKIIQKPGQVVGGTATLNLPTGPRYHRIEIAGVDLLGALIGSVLRHLPRQSDHWTDETIDIAAPWPACRAMMDSADDDPGRELERIAAKGRKHLAAARHKRGASG